MIFSLKSFTSEQENKRRTQCFYSTQWVFFRIHMNDLETAKTLLIQKQLTLIIIKNGETLYETKSHRISGFLNAIEQCGRNLKNAAAADTIVGKAVALLTVYSEINAVYAETLSKKGKEFLEENKITVEWKELIDNILDDKKQNICPFEKEAEDITNPKEAYDKFKVLQQKMRACH